MNKYSLEAKVGLFFLIAVAIFVYVWFRVLEFRDHEGFVLLARFKTVEGLVVGAQVQVAGVRVGKVQDVRFDGETGKAVVELALNNAYLGSITEGSKASLKSKGLLGDKYVVVDPGKPNARKLKPGQEVTSVQEATDQEKLLDDMGVIAQDVKVMAREARRQFIDEQGSKKLGSTVDNADAVFKNLRTLLARNSEKVDQVVDNADRALRNLDDVVTRNKPKINKSVDDMERFSAGMDKTGDKFAKVAADLDSITRDIRAGKGTLGKLVNDEALHRDAHALVRELRQTVDRVQNGGGAMGRLINDPELYFEARRAIRNMNKTAEDVSEATPVSTLAIILGAMFK